MLEKEYKFLLTREQYDALKEYFQWNNTFEQFNYYYNDMDNYIYNNNITVRIREGHADIFLDRYAYTPSII